jgi:hypothetical protein
MRKFAWTEKLLKAKRLWRRHLNLVGVDYGYAYKKGELLKKLAIRFHVREKRGLADLPPESVLPRLVDGLRCDVIEATYSLHATPHEECTPLQPGVSVGNLETGETGSIGLFGTITGQPGKYILSNWHVLGGGGTAQKGDRICQPGPGDVSDGPARIVAHLSKWTDLATGIDAAIALVDPSIGTSDQLFNSKVDIADWEDATPNMKVVKAGAYSGFTHGIVDGAEGTFEMNYINFGDQKRWMDGIRLRRDPDYPETEISIAGDSGAVWVNAETGRAVALHFGGEDCLGPSEEYALAHPIRRVFELLGIEVAQRSVG